MDILTNLFDRLVFIFERLNWLSVVDLALVTIVFFAILLVLRDTQAIILLRGVLLLIVLINLLTGFKVLPAFSWLVTTTLPAVLLAVPVIFAPEIRRALERLGRAGIVSAGENTLSEAQQAITAVVSAANRLSLQQQGALIVLQRADHLDEYLRTGIRLDARVSAELLLQIFYPNTPLHDGAAIIAGTRVVAASCVMPLSSSGVLAPAVERRMGLRHRAALGISEVSDAVVVVVSEETGTISVVHRGRMIRRLDGDRLENILRAFYAPPSAPRGLLGWLEHIRSGTHRPRWEAHR